MPLPSEVEISSQEYATESVLFVRVNPDFKDINEFIKPVCILN